jgi:hypothetical protein
MAKARTHRTALGCLLAVVLSSAPAPLAQGDSMLATVGNPATITATRSVSADEAPAQRRRVIVSVTGYHPSDDGSPVEVVVYGRAGDTEREVGRFGITPDREFTAADPAHAQRFRLTLPLNLATDLGSGNRLTFTVHVVPVRGGGKGASLRVGSIEFF